MAATVSITINVPAIVAHRLAADTSKKGVTQDQNASNILCKAFGDAADIVANSTVPTDKWTLF